MQTDLVLEIPNDLRAIEHAVEYVVRCCESCEESAREMGVSFRVGLTEALSNAMLYGNDRDPGKRVRVEVLVNGAEVSVCVTDEGDGFDPRNIPDPTTPSNVTKPCGRGLFLMRKLMDEVRFNDKGNSVTMIVRLGECAEADRLGGGARA